MRPCVSHVRSDQRKQEKFYCSRFIQLAKIGVVISQE